MATATASTSLRPPPSPFPPRLAGSLRQWCWGMPTHSSRRRAFHAHPRKRNTLLCAAVKGPEESFKKTIEMDRLIDMLRDANPRELDLIVVENILAFSEGFWVRLAARIDLCKSDDDKKDYEELAENVMNIVDRVVHKTDEKIEQSTDVLKAIISPVMNEGEDGMWPPRNPEALKLMEKEISNREKEGQLDESFLSEVNAQLRQAKDEVDKPGLQVMLQKVLQLYASNFLRKRSYAYKAPENDWNRLLLDGLTVGKGDVSPEEFYAVTKKRIERILIRTEGGSYQQRVLVEYIKEIQARAEEIVNRLQGPAV
ncbi:uncharacterized protein LOC119335295 isoform X2 [Triticum dicoccoides]|nr:uncharacterized protein LOC119335295 isoform X2 [Triticum dicoccoides]